MQSNRTYSQINNYYYYYYYYYYQSSTNSIKQQPKLNNNNNSKTINLINIIPLGFRFYPTDEELISHYLYSKVLRFEFRRSSDR
ncbi:putative transcription factor NAM family [Helianthus annuus]|nr:putative transcription factor NAM family [Helianthus annuus]